jgi:DNA recombination protein RmuC
MSIGVLLLLWMLLRLSVLRELKANQQQSLLALSALQATTDSLDQRMREMRQQGIDDAARLRETLLERADATRLAAAQDLSHGFQGLHRLLGETLQRGASDLGQRVEALTRATDERLKEISGQVDRRLAEGFEKTTATFADVLQRLALIDEAQKKITALSTDVVSLQQILADKRSRGAFGEVQLASLVRNVMPEASFKLQHTLPNGKIADCALFLPAPTGMLAIDAKFPLESYRRMTDFALPELERKPIERQFKQDIRKHIRDIASRYIIANVTSDGAMMFIPAEAVFAEIQAHHPELVDEAHAARVWLVSPTTLWAVLNTACAVLKDAATREQVDIIRQHLGFLAKDFLRFRERMDQLARHVEQAHEDVQKVHVSARRISERFERIERVEIDSAADKTLETPVSSADSAN